MNPGGERRVVAEISTTDARQAIPTVGNRSIHQYWKRLTPALHALLLAPRRRPDDRAISWSWVEPALAPPPSTAELADLRRHLVEASRLLTEDAAEAKPAEATWMTIMQAIIGELCAKSDPQFSTFVARTDAGLQIHSWGAPQGGRPYSPDKIGAEVHGTLLAGDSAAAGYEVVIENRKGTRLAHAVSDERGNFVFAGIHPGTYRVRVNSDRLDFPVHGLDLVVERQAVSGLVLRSRSLQVARQPGANGTDPPMAIAPESFVAPSPPSLPTLTSVNPPHRTRRRVRFFSLFLFVVIAITGVVQTWRNPPAFFRSLMPAPFAPGSNLPASHPETSAGNSGWSAAPSTVGLTRPSVTQPVARSRIPRDAPAVEGPDRGVDRINASRSQVAAAREESPRSLHQPPVFPPTTTVHGASPDPRRRAALGNAATPDTADLKRPAATTPAPDAPGVNRAAPNPSDSMSRSASPLSDGRTEPSRPPAAPVQPGRPLPTGSATTTSVQPLPSAPPTRPPPAPKSNRAAQAKTDRSLPPPPASNDDRGGAVSGGSTAAANTAPSLQEPVEGDDVIAPLHPTLTKIRLHFQISNWISRLVRDEILPTPIVRQGEKVEVEALRAQVRQRLRELMPASIRNPKIHFGLRWELPADRAGNFRARWHTADAPAHGAATASTCGVAIDLADSPPSPNPTYTLEDGTGRVIARVSANPSAAGWSLEADPAVRCWFWIAAEGPPDEPGLTAGTKKTTRFTWRRPPDLPLSAEWKSDDSRRRIESLLRPGSGLGAPSELALVDDETGWATVGRVTVRAGSFPTSP